MVKPSTNLFAIKYPDSGKTEFHFSSLFNPGKRCTQITNSYIAGLMIIDRIIKGWQEKSPLESTQGTRTTLHHPKLVRQKG
jgi:hypothetical protein